jgi:hypothetical protein
LHFCVYSLGFRYVAGADVWLGASWCRAPLPQRAPGVALRRGDAELSGVKTAPTTTVDKEDAAVQPHLGFRDGAAEAGWQPVSGARSRCARREAALRLATLTLPRAPGS